MAWRTIASTETDPGAPLTAELNKAYANNPAAIANADSGAPKIVDDALSTNVTQSGKDWVLARLPLDVGLVGTYAFLRTTASLNPGDTIAGSSLEYASIANVQVDTSTNQLKIRNTSTSVSGTWKIMGFADNTGSGGNITPSVSLFLRIA